MVTITAAQMHSETDYDTDDISVTNLEYLIDNAIDYVNLHAGQSIADMAGGPPKSVTVSENQATVLKPLIVLMMRAYVDKGPNVGTGGLSVSTVISDPQFKLQIMLWKSSLKRLCGSSFQRT